MAGLFALAALLLLALACGSAATPVEPTAAATPPLAGSIVVSAAADLRYAFEELSKVFQDATGVEVNFNFGSTGQLAQQIERGASVDVFAAANVSFVDELIQQGHILPDTKAMYARGFTVLWTREDNPAHFDRVEDLIQPAAPRIAIANPDHAPYGVAAREALQTAGIWEQVQPKLVLGENVSQTLQYAQTGNVDVAIVALSLAVAPNIQGGRYARIPQEMHKPIDQALGVVTITKNEAAARAFAKFVNGPQGRPIMERYGFVLPNMGAGR